MSNIGLPSNIASSLQLTNNRVISFALILDFKNFTFASILILYPERCWAVRDFVGFLPVLVPFMYSFLALEPLILFSLILHLVQPFLISFCPHSTTSCLSPWTSSPELLSCSPVSESGRQGEVCSWNFLSNALWKVRQISFWLFSFQEAHHLRTSPSNAKLLP